MLNFTAKEMLKLHRLFDGKILKMLHSNDMPGEYKRSAGDSWISTGRTYCRYDSNQIIFKLDSIRMDDYVFEDILKRAPYYDPEHEARILHYEAISQNFVAVVEQPNYSVIVRIDYNMMKIFGNDFQFQLSAHPNSPLYIYYFGQLVGIILPVVTQDELEMPEQEELSHPEA